MSLVRSQLVSVDFYIDIKSFRSHYGPGVDSTSNRNEYQEFFLGGKCSRCVRLTTLPPSCAVVTKSGNLNFREPSGPVQACNGTEFIFFYHIMVFCLITVNLPYSCLTQGTASYKPCPISLLVMTNKRICNTSYASCLLTFRRLMSTVVDVPHR